MWQNVSLTLRLSICISLFKSGYYSLKLSSDAEFQAAVARLPFVRAFEGVGRIICLAIFRAQLFFVGILVRLSATYHVVIAYNSWLTSHTLMLANFFSCQLCLASVKVSFVIRTNVLTSHSLCDLTRTPRFVRRSEELSNLSSLASVLELHLARKYTQQYHSS
jgi:hypothetical protein